MTMFNWPELLRVGLQGLRLKPEEFWALTPFELRIMLGESGVSRTLNRTGLEALLEAYPDKQKGSEDERH